METARTETPKLPEMVKLKLRRMCGDHPSITKTELNVKEDPKEEKEKIMSASFAKLTPTASTSLSLNLLHISMLDIYTYSSPKLLFFAITFDQHPFFLFTLLNLKKYFQPSRTERAQPTFVPELRARTMSEHALRAIEARRRTHPGDVQQRNDYDPLHANRALIQAALGSFRWPPYLVCVWVLVLLVSHLLHCLVGVLERSLPAIHKFCLYFRTWTEESWRGEDLNNKLYPIGLACITALLYAFYCALYFLYSVALWAVEPLCSEAEEKPSVLDVPKITNYIDEIHSKTAVKC
ncbi:unnamed protein product [Leptosia nina]|uniref:Uncharacterized protein n=1 Tax=Leptosia nina TaxID=320188 RepID=A0AAV1K1L3_9NEOP